MSLADILAGSLKTGGPGMRARPLRSTRAGDPAQTIIYGVYGAAYRTRTCGPIITNDVLYQLS